MADILPPHERKIVTGCQWKTWLRVMNIAELDKRSWLIFSNRKDFQWSRSNENCRGICAKDELTFTWGVFAWEKFHLQRGFKCQQSHSKHSLRSGWEAGRNRSHSTVWMWWKKVRHESWRDFQSFSYGLIILKSSQL